MILLQLLAGDLGFVSRSTVNDEAAGFPFRLPWLFFAALGDMKAVVASEVQFVVIPVSALAALRITQAVRERARADATEFEDLEIIGELARVNVCVEPGVCCAGG